jgi:hypothetical protein
LGKIEKTLQKKLNFGRKAVSFVLPHHKPYLLKEFKLFIIKFFRTLLCTLRNIDISLLKSTLHLIRAMFATNCIRVRMCVTPGGVFEHSLAPVQTISVAEAGFCIYRTVLLDVLELRANHMDSRI